MSYETLLYKQENGIATITINRPEVRNAINFRVMEKIGAILDDIESSREISALILTGAGAKSFCAGGDLKEFGSLETSEDARKMCVKMLAILSRLEGLDIPVIAAINGDAFGGGCEIITACDIRFASEGARFGFRQIRYGIITGWGGTLRLLRSIGRSNSLRLLLTGEVITASEAWELGLVDKVFPHEDLMLSTYSLAQQIASNPPQCVRAYKRLVRHSLHDNSRAAIALETELFCQLWISDYRKQAFESFGHKR